MANEARRRRNEADLVERAREGDRSAFQHIVETHKGQVFRIALGYARNHHDAEDLVQEVFLRAYTTLKSFRGDARLATWLYRMTVNICHDADRKRRARRSEATASLDEQPVTLVEESADADPERLAEARGIRRDIDRGVRELSPRERSIWVLRHDAHLSVAEIAATIGKAEGTVKNLHFRAVRKLRRHLAHYLNPEKGGARP